MKVDYVPLIVGGMVFLASLISLKLGLSVIVQKWFSPKQSEDLVETNGESE